MNHQRNSTTRQQAVPSGRAMLERWLTAERSGDETGAESSLSLLIRDLPVPAARPGFADRILECAGLDRASRRERWRAGAAIAGASGGLGWLAVSFLWSHFDAALLVARIGAFFQLLVDLVGVLLGVSALLVRIGELGRAVATTPELTVGLVGLVLVAGLAFAGLAFLLERSRDVPA